MKNQLHIPELIFKKISETISDEEQKTLDTWINQSSENKKIYQETISDDNIKAALKKYFKYDIEKAWLKTEKRLSSKQKPTILLYKKILRYAAIISIPLLIASYLIFQFPTSDNDNTSQNNIDLPFEPGTEKAILTLNNGEEIAVGKYQHADTILISESTQVVDSNYTLVYDQKNITASLPEYNTLSTPRGGEYSLVLSDGSKVWLNAESKLKYPVQFQNNLREVFVEGEAYFEITENKEKPFIVHTNAYDVNVLGTSFNVMAYNDEQKITTTLVEGSVKITKTESEESVYLIPGQQATQVSKSEKIKIASVDTRQYTSWKDGLFVFNSEPLSSIAKKFSRWYDCEIQFTDQKLKNAKFTGTLNMKTDLANQLNIISQTCQIDFSLDDKGILIISKK